MNINPDENIAPGNIPTDQQISRQLNKTRIALEVHGLDDNTEIPSK
jgi:hypothetical protein